MSQDFTLKALVSTLLALISAPTSFVIITVWLLLSNTALDLWVRLSIKVGRSWEYIFEVCADAFYKLVKNIGILFFTLTSASAASKFGPAFHWLEVSAYAAIGLWLFTMIGKNASKLMGSQGFTEVIDNLIKRYKGSSE